MTDQVRATGAVVDFISRARWKDFPAEAVVIAKRCISMLGVYLAGPHDFRPHSPRLRPRHGLHGRTRPRSGPSRSGRRGVSGAPQNGTSEACLDWDDTQLATSADRIFAF